MFAPARSCIRKRRNDDRLTGARTSRDAASFTLGALAGQLANATNGFGLFTRTLLGRLFEIVAHLHFTEDAFALHLLLESAESLINVVIADKYLHENPVPLVLLALRTLVARQIDYVRAARRLAIGASDTRCRRGSPARSARLLRIFAWRARKPDTCGVRTYLVEALKSPLFQEGRGVGFAFF